MKRLSTALLTGVLFALSFGSAAAETFQMERLPGDRPYMGIRFLKPDFPGDANLTFFSAVYEFYANAPITDRLNFAISVPFARANFDVENQFIDPDDGSIGNVFLGLQLRHETTGGGINAGTFGVFAPTAPDDLDAAAFVGLGAEGFFRFPRYAPDATTVFVNNSYRSAPGEGLFWGLEGGLQFIIPGEDDNEAFLHYGLRGGAEVNPILIEVELVGSLWMTADNVDEIGEQLSHGFGFGGRFLHSIVRPGVFYMVYIDEELDDFVNGVFVADLMFVMP